MKRLALADLDVWLNSVTRKPLLLKGARQVGKTYLLKEFARASGRTWHYVDFRDRNDLRSVFANAASFEESLSLLQYGLNTRINRDADILILDELQDCPGGVPALKNFHEQTPNLAVIGAGSHLGLTLNEEPFPVGKVDFGHVRPLAFEEFLLAADPRAFELYGAIDIRAPKPVPIIIHEALIRHFTAYTVVGGMPEAVAAYIESGGQKSPPETMLRVRSIQQALIDGYKSDFTKYSGREHAAHILSVFESIPSQLGKALDESVSKYSFSRVIPNKKGFAAIRGPLSWLEKAGLCIKVPIASKASHPIAGYTHDNVFKLYLFDTGLLNAMLSTPPAALIADRLGSYKGYLAENIIAQELSAHKIQPLFALMEGRSEIEFLLLHHEEILPIEVKAAKRARTAKSLYAFCERYSPSEAYKLTGQNINYHDEYRILTIPLYLAGKLLPSSAS